MSRALNTVLVAIASFIVVLVLSACDGNYLVWSSDGKLGAIVGARGLRICEGEGAISPVLVEKAGMFRWIPQEHQGLVVGYEYVHKWSDLKPLLTANQARLIADESNKLRQKLFSYHGDPKKFGELNLKGLSYPLEAALQLHGSSAELDRTASRKWPAYLSVKVPVFYVRLAQVEAQSAKLGRTIDRGIDEIVELRVSPNGKQLACVKHEIAQERNYIAVMPLAGGKPLTIGYDTNSYPDWSADSRTVFYSRANSSGESDLLKGRGQHEGGLFKAEVLDGSGKLLAAPKTQRLANLIFDNRAPIRCLKDGRLLFASREIRLPNSTSASTANSVFVLDGSRVDNIVHRNDDVVYFEPSPEQDQLAVSLGGGGSLLVSKINGTDAFELCNGKDVRLSGLLPQWRTNSELSYGQELPSAKGGKPTYAIQLWSRSGGAKELSKNWSKEASSELSMHRDIFQEAMTGVIEEMDRAADR